MKKENPMLGIADWLAKESRIDEAQKVLDTVHKSKKSSEEDKVIADKMTKELKLKNRERIAETVKKFVVMRKVSSMSPHPDVEKEMLTKAKDYNDIKNDIDNRGIQVPLVIDSDNKVVCGITRWKICKELGIEEVPVFLGNFDLYEDLLDYAVRDNIMRRQIDESEKVGLYSRLLKKQGETVVGRPPRELVPGDKRAKDAVFKKVDKAITTPIKKEIAKLPDRKLSKVVEKDYKLVVGKDGNRDREFPKMVGDEVEKQIELFKVNGYTIDIHVKYEVWK